MFDEREREMVALARFALVAPVLNGQVDNRAAYFRELADTPHHIGGRGPRLYAPKTFARWLSDYRRGGLDALKPGYRSDRGKSRSVSSELAEKIIQRMEEGFGGNRFLLYQTLCREGVVNPRDVSLSSYYRFLKTVPPTLKEGDTTREQKRFAHQFVNELWQGDIMYGPSVRRGRSRQPTYLVAFLDDASRLVSGARFTLKQDFLALRQVFKEAVLRRGIPHTLYSDNGKVYRSHQFSLLCAALGCTLVYARPYAPQGKGKIERFFRTVRERFLSTLSLPLAAPLEELNRRFASWLKEDYQHKIHSALGMSPLDFYLSQLSRVKLPADPAWLEEQFLLREMRRVGHDATFSLHCVLYETSPELAGERVEVRYDPPWVGSVHHPLLLYRENRAVGEARPVDYAGNSRLRRRGRPGREEGGEHEGPEGEENRRTILSFTQLGKESEG